MTKIRLAMVAVVQLALVGLAVYPQLSARATGEEYRLAVGVYDPIDPQRGAYVDLSYPALQRIPDHQEGDVYVVLKQDGELWTSQDFTTTRPEVGPYLACHDTGWSVRCGIESWYLPEYEAASLGQALWKRHGVATIRVDSRGHAAIVAVDPR